MAGDGLPLTVRTIEGSPLEVVFDRGALPTRGFEVGVNLRAVETMYPGNNGKSVQIMGVEYEPIVLEGFARDTWQEENGAAIRLTKAGRALVLAQRLCQMEWGDSLVVRGYLRNFRQMPDKDGEQRWRLEFMVLESDEASSIRPPTALPTATQSTLSKVLDALGEAEDLVSEATYALNAINVLL